MSLSNMKKEIKTINNLLASNITSHYYNEPKEYAFTLKQYMTVNNLIRRLDKEYSQGIRVKKYFAELNPRLKSFFEAEGYTDRSSENSLTKYIALVKASFRQKINSICSNNK